MKINLKKGTVIEVYTNLENENFGLGKVLDFDDENLLILSISPLGEWDGIVLYKFNDIFKVAYDTIYSKKVLSLNQCLNDVEKQYDFGPNKIKDLLNRSQKHNKIIDIQLLYSHQCDVSGIVLSIDKNTCTILQITDLGEENGICQISVMDITGIRYDSIENRRIERIYNIL